MDASQFSTQPRGGLPRLTRTHWNWYLRKRLGEEIATALVATGVGPGHRVVELGCGARPYETLVRATGADYEGADLKGNPHLDVLIADDGRVQVEDGRYDVVIAAQVLEHVPDPGAYLAETLRLLKPNGWLILSTHGIWIYHPCPLDLWRWTGAGLQRVITMAGYRIERFVGIVGLVPAGLHLIQDHLYKRLALRRRVLIGKPFVWLMQSLIAWSDRLHGERGRATDAMIFLALARPAPHSPGRPASADR